MRAVGTSLLVLVPTLGLGTSTLNQKGCVQQAPQQVVEKVPMVHSQPMAHAMLQFPG